MNMIQRGLWLLWTWRRGGPVNTISNGPTGRRYTVSTVVQGPFFETAVFEGQSLDANRIAHVRGNDLSMAKPTHQYVLATVFSQPPQAWEAYLGEWTLKHPGVMFHDTR